MSWVETLVKMELKSKGKREFSHCISHSIIYPQRWSLGEKEEKKERKKETRVSHKCSFELTCSIIPHHLGDRVLLLCLAG